MIKIPKKKVLVDISSSWLTDAEIDERLEAEILIDEKPVIVKKEG